MLDQYEDFDSLIESVDFYRLIFVNEQGFSKCKKEGAGVSTIKSFLGEVYSTYQIQQALADLPKSQSINLYKTSSHDQMREEVSAS